MPLKSLCDKSHVVKATMLHGSLYDHFQITPYHFESDTTIL